MRVNPATQKATHLRMQILDAVDKSIQKCTVSEICESAGVSRQAFYRLFDSKFEIINWWCKTCEADYLNRIGFDYSWEEGYLRFVHAAFSKAAFLNNALTEFPPDLFDAISLRLKQNAVIALEKKGVIINDFMDYCAGMYGTGATQAGVIIADSIVEKRIGFIEAAKMYVSIVPAPLYNALQLDAEKEQSQSFRIAHMDEIALKVFDSPDS